MHRVAIVIVGEVPTILTLFCTEIVKFPNAFLVPNAVITVVRTALLRALIATEVGTLQLRRPLIRVPTAGSL